MKTVARGYERSARLYERARHVIAGGVSSDARRADQPLFVDHARGAELWDVDGNPYIDYVLGQGPAISSATASPPVVEATRRKAARGIVYSAQHEAGSACGPTDVRHGPGRRAGQVQHRRVRGRPRGAAPGSRLHRPAQGAQVRGALPRLVRSGALQRASGGRRGRTGATPVCPGSRARAGSSLSSARATPSCWRRGTTLTPWRRPWLELHGPSDRRGRHGTGAVQHRRHRARTPATCLVPANCATATAAC